MPPHAHPCPVEWIPSSNVSPWNLLHDGAVTGVHRSGERATITVEIPYLRVRFASPGRGFRLELRECTHLELTPYDEAPTSSPDEIVLARADIVEAEVAEDDVVVVWGSRGVLRLRYGALALRFDDGTPLALAALDACARAYWDEWDQRVRRPLLDASSPPVIVLDGVRVPRR